MARRLDDSAAHTEQVKGERPVWQPENGFVNATVYNRYVLHAGDRLTGPAIVEERESTTLVPVGAELHVDEYLNLRLQLPQPKAEAVKVAAHDELSAAMERLETDPFGLQIMWSRFINITEECWQTVIRTAFSLIIGEAQDFACEILDAKGRQIAHSPRAMPVFNLTLPMAINAMIERYPTQVLTPGDVLITNDPWLCAGHLFDIALAVPVFHDDRVVAFVGVVGHVTDVGGTKDQLNAGEIYDEGLQIPPMKIFKAGVPNDDLFDIIRENVRLPEPVLGDLHSLIGAGLTGVPVNFAAASARSFVYDACTTTAHPVRSASIPSASWHPLTACLVEKPARRPAEALARVTNLASRWAWVGSRSLPVSTRSGRCAWQAGRDMVIQ